MKTSRPLASILTALTGIAILSSLTPSIATAQSACYVPGSGTVYRIKEPNTPTQCSTGHVEFQLTAAAKPGGGGPTGPAGGDLGGSYPNPSVVKIQGQPISANVPSAGQVLTFSGGSWSPQSAGAASLPTNGSGAFDFSNVNGIVANATDGVGSFPASGAGGRFMWVSSLAALRVGKVDGTQWNNGSVGHNSAAFGLNATASGDQSFALGNATTANGGESFAAGGSTVASGQYSTALGSFGHATAVASTVLGYNGVASGTDALAAGYSSTASGSHSVAIGTTALASGAASMAFGNIVTASNQNAMAFGDHTTASADYSTAMGNYANTSGMLGTFVYGDRSTTSVVGAPLDNSFIVRAQHFWFGTTSAPTAASGHLIETSTGAYLSTGGTWTNTSDVNKKHAFQTVDSEDVLARIDAMPVSTWTYNTESDSVRHMGPTAQDFRKAFGLGDTEKAIATVDADGVSLAAIKALLQRTTQLRNENADLKAMIADLAQRLTQLEQTRR